MRPSIGIWLIKIGVEKNYIYERKFFYQEEYPPSTVKEVPVMYFAFSESKKEYA